MQHQENKLTEYSNLHVTLHLTWTLLLLEYLEDLCNQQNGIV